MFELSGVEVIADVAEIICCEMNPVRCRHDLSRPGTVTCLETITCTRKRDPAFRQRVLTAYDWRCAVCGFDVRLGSVSIALDAAPIRRHQAGGPDVESNGLALCVLHHKTFDLGAFTVADCVLLVSDQTNGTTGFREHLLAYHGKPIRPAQRPDWRPQPAHLEWHGRGVQGGGEGQEMTVMIGGGPMSVTPLRCRLDVKEYGRRWRSRTPDLAVPSSFRDSAAAKGAPRNWAAPSGCTGG